MLCVILLVRPEIEVVPSGIAVGILPKGISRVLVESVRALQIHPLVPLVSVVLGPSVHVPDQEPAFRNVPIVERGPGLTAFDQEVLLFAERDLVHRPPGCHGRKDHVLHILPHLDQTVVIRPDPAELFEAVRAEGGAVVSAPPDRSRSHEPPSPDARRILARR